MSKSQTISRGFHRLAVLLAAIPLLVGVGFSIALPVETASRSQKTHEQLVCAQGKIEQVAARKIGKALTFEQAQACKKAYPGS